MGRGTGGDGDDLGGCGCGVRAAVADNVVGGYFSDGLWVVSLYVGDEGRTNGERKGIGGGESMMGVWEEDLHHHKMEL